MVIILRLVWPVAVAAASIVAMAAAVMISA